MVLEAELRSCTRGACLRMQPCVQPVPAWSPRGLAAQQRCCCAPQSWYAPAAVQILHQGGTCLEAIRWVVSGHCACASPPILLRRAQGHGRLSRRYPRPGLVSHVGLEFHIIAWATVIKRCADRTGADPLHEPADVGSGLLWPQPHILHTQGRTSHWRLPTVRMPSSST